MTRVIIEKVITEKALTASWKLKTENPFLTNLKSLKRGS